MNAEERKQMYNDKVVPILEKKNITPYRLTKDLGLSPSALQRWKDGLSVPKIENLTKIADYLGVSITHFYEDK